MRFFILLFFLLRFQVYSFAYVVNSCGSKLQIVLPKNIISGVNVLTSSMITHANMVYVIEHEFDLKGNKLVLPFGCTLLFKGGSIRNGEIVGNETLLKGDVKVPYLKGKFANTTLHSSVINEANDYDKLKSILTIGVNNIVLDENYVITKFKGTIVSNSNIDCFNSIIYLETDIQTNGMSACFIKLENVQYFRNFELDGNNHALLSVVSFANSDNIIISNIKIHDIDSSSVNTLPSYCNCLVITLKDSAKVNIKGVVIRNIKSKANGVIGDSTGNISGILVQSAANQRYSVIIDNCFFEELHNYKDGKVIFEDVSCIYVSQVRPFNNNSNVYITNITGYNFGKRLIKTDSSNVYIDGVKAENYVPDVLSVIGLNDGNASTDDDRPIHSVIRNVSFKGNTNFVIASSVKNTIVENVESEITDLVSIAGNRLSSVFTGNTFSKVRNVKMRGAQLLFTQATFKEALNYFNASHIDYDDTMYNHSSYGNYFLCTFNGHITLTNVKIKTGIPLFLFADNYPDKQNLSESIHIKNIKFESLGSYSSGLFSKSENALKKNFSISIENGEFMFNGPVRWFMKVAYPDMIKLKDLSIYINASNPYSLLLSVDYKPDSQLYLKNIRYKLPDNSLDVIYLNNHTGKVVKCHAINIHGNKNGVSLHNVLIEGNFTPFCIK